MEGLINLALEVAAGGQIWLFILAHAVGVSFVIGALLLRYWQVRQGAQGEGRMWVPMVCALCGFLLMGISNVFRAAAETLGGEYGPMTSFTQPDIGGIAGMGPMETVVFLVNAFIWFFRFIGGKFMFDGLVAWHGRTKGTRQHPGGFILVKLAAGALTMNADVVARQMAETMGGGGGV